MQVELRRVAWPAIEAPVERPTIDPDEYEARADALYDAVGSPWVAVYGDREHAGNLLWLTGYDPRFEEALLLLGPGRRRALLVGIEGLAYARGAGLPVDLRFYHPFSILGQPHVDSPPLPELLREIGLSRGQRAGVAGWKTIDAREVDDATAPAFVPAFLVRAIEGITGGPALDVTALLLDPERGQRNKNSAAQIAIYEWGAARGSAALLRVVRGARPGMTEYEAAALFAYQGEPLTMHPIVSASDGDIDGLRSPSAREIGLGDAITAGIGYWGGLCCRAGMMREEPDAAFLAELVVPYYRAIATWWEAVALGVTGGEIDAAVRGALAGAPFASFVNPGHLTSYEEWVHSPVRSGSQQRIASGMAMQCDIIPSPLPTGRALNCEDSLAIADEPLRDELAARFPALWARIEARRAFMRDVLGIRPRPEVLPLSVAPALLPPCWLDPELVCTVAG